LSGGTGPGHAHFERVDAVFADLDLPRHPGAALLVIDHDEIAYRKCYGTADLETGRSITAESSFYLASISKQFTAMAVMLLAEQGKLRFDDRMAAYLPRFPSWGGDITLRHMLHHTSGLPGYHLFIPELHGVTNEDVLERVMDLDRPEFPAGTKFAYNDTAYTLLATVVTIVSGRPFADFLKARIFDPLGMKHTVAYDASRPARHALVPGYLKQGGEFMRWEYPLLTVGDGGIFSTLDDLFLWDQALNTERLVPTAALERAFATGTTNDGTPLGYGFGWYANSCPGRRHVAHGGSLGAYNNYIIRYLDTQRTIIVLTNLGPIEPVYRPPGLRGPRPRAHQVAEILFGA
jgi:CubicO group peptidase (beta-lactamase class C family)